MKYKIINRKRFITACTISILLLAAIMAPMFSFVTAQNDHIEKSFVNVKVSEGDTLWNLAKEYGPSNQNVRKTIHDICELNNIDAGKIYPGQIIIIPENL